MFKNRRSVSLALACSFGLACMLGFLHMRPTAAPAAITILKADGSPVELGEATKIQNPLNGEWEITLSSLYDPGGWTTYEIHGDGGEVISDLFIDVPCWTDSNGDCIPAGSPVVVRVISDDEAGVATVRNIVQTGTAETFLNYVDVSEDIGRVEVEAIGEMYAGRDVVGPVVATTKDNRQRGVAILVAYRDVLGDVSADNGRIGTVLAHRRIGAPGEHVNIRAKHETKIVVSLEGIWAHIDSRFNGGDGGLYWIYSTTFNGTVNTKRLKNNQNFEDPRGRIQIFDAFHGTITIGDPLDHPDHFIELPQFGLSGQVIVNADAQPGGVWTSPVYLGPPDGIDHFVLEGPHYPQPAALLGGGAIGLVPFSVHLESCDPPSGTSLGSGTPEAPGGPEAPAVVTLRHYGPIALDGPAPIAIERRPFDSDDPFEPVGLGAFAITVSESDPNTLVVAAAPGQAGFEAGYEYRIVATEQLRCDVTARPPVSWHAPYTLAIAPGVTCVADLDGSGAVDFDDLLDLLFVWGPCGSCPADLDGNGVVDFSDLLTMLFEWGPC